MKTLLVLFFIGFSFFLTQNFDQGTYASDSDTVGAEEWHPMIYEFLSKEAKNTVDRLDLTDSMNSISINQLFHNLRMQNCKLDSTYKQGLVQISIEDTQSRETYYLDFPAFKSRAGAVSKSSFASEPNANLDYYMAVTDTKDIKGLTFEGATYTLEVHIEQDTGVIAQVLVLSHFKTIFNGIFLKPLGSLMGRKPVEEGLELVCLGGAAS